LYSLKGIKRIRLKPGESSQVKFTVTPEMLAMINEKGQSIVEPGVFKVYIAGASPSSRSEALGMPKAQEVLLTVK
jgi:beta-glucosidase